MIEVYLGSASTVTYNDLSLLDEHERDLARGLGRTPAWAGFVASRALARSVLGERLGIEPSAVPLARRCGSCGSTEHGKPYVVGFSLQHSVARAGALVGVAVSHDPVGLDLVDAHAVPEGADAVVGLPGAAPGDVARQWARTEAVLKLGGQGLALAPEGVRLSRPTESPRLLQAPFEEAARVRLADLDLTPRWAGAVACLDDEPRVRLHASPDGTGGELWQE